MGQNWDQKEPTPVDPMVPERGNKIAKKKYTFKSSSNNIYHRNNNINRPWNCNAIKNNRNT